MKQLFSPVQVFLVTKFFRTPVFDKFFPSFLFSGPRHRSICFLPEIPRRRRRSTGIYLHFNFGGLIDMRPKNLCPSLQGFYFSISLPHFFFPVST